MRSLMLSVGAFFAIEAASPVVAGEDPLSHTRSAASTALHVGGLGAGLDLLIPPLRLCITCWPGSG